MASSTNSTTPRADWRSEVNCLKVAAVTGLSAELILRAAGHRAIADLLHEAFPGRHVARIPADQLPPGVKAAVNTLLHASARGVPLRTLQAQTRLRRQPPRAHRESGSSSVLHSRPIA